MASGDSVQQIKDRLNILDVVGQYVELHRAGKHFKGRCPFHNEKTPSFHVSPDRGTYHCFGCGAGGDIFSFVEAIDGVEFKEALKTLAQKAGVELVPEAPEKRTEREKLVAIMEAATNFYVAELDKNTEALTYLERRGVTKETIIKWRIGYAPGPPLGGWRAVKSHLNDIGYQDDLILKAGLIKHADQGKEPFDVFRDRIVFPLRDAAGRVVAFSGRILHPDEKSPKYVNSPETPLYRKSNLLYGYDFAKQHLKQLPFWLLVEGQFDVVMSHQAGYKTAVAVSGTALTTEHVQLLERLSKNVVLALDTDKAGIAAMKKGAELMLRRGLDVKVARFGEGLDPADMVIKDLAGFKQAVGGAVPVIEFFLQDLLLKYKDPRAYKLQVRELVIPFVSLIPNRIDQEHFIGVIATALQSSVEAVRFEVDRIQSSAIHETETTKVTPVATFPRESVELLEKTYAFLRAAVDVVSPAMGEVVTTKLTELATLAGVDLAGRVTTEALRQLTFQIETQFEQVSAKGQEEELVYRLQLLRELVIKERLQKSRATLAAADGDGVGEMAVMQTLMAELQQPPYTTLIFAASSRG